jgi:hypothetical protein
MGGWLGYLIVNSLSYLWFMTLNLRVTVPSSVCTAKMKVPVLKVDTSIVITF